MTPKMRSLREFRNPIRCLILLAAFAAAAGCSTAESPAGSSNNMNHILPSGSSVAGWLVVPSGGTHTSSATLDYIANNGSSGCTECHGSDLSGGISKVSCFSDTAAGCHHVTAPTAPPWGDPAVHGATAKKAPGSSGFASCQICHGKDFSGFSTAPACEDCHGIPAPHPSLWLTSSGGTYNHDNTDTANAPVCAQCHQSAAGTPGCFNNTLCHGEAGHPAGWVAAPPSANQPHGAAAKAANGFPGCQTCHGSTLDGTASSGNVSCFQATWNGFNCHNGGAVSNWPHAPPPWRASAGSVHTHTNTDNTGNPGNPSVCADCHRSNPGTPGCYNNTLCHAGGAAHAVPYNEASHYAVTSATFPGSCSTCHDVSAPSTKTGPPCQTCHVAASPLTALNCTSCHASPPNNLAPAGAAYPNIAGAHGVHLALNTPSNPNGTPVTCDTCHNGLGPSLLNLNHYNNAASRVAPGNAAFLATYNAESGASSFLAGSFTCTNVSCHGGQATPNWRTGAIDPNTQCTSCHAQGTAQYNSYDSGEHDKHVNDEGLSCTQCHNTATLAGNHFTTLSTPAMEGPASATVGGGTTNVVTYNAGSCTPTSGTGCHGARNW